MMPATAFSEESFVHSGGMFSSIFVMSLGGVIGSSVLMPFVSNWISRSALYKIKTTKALEMLAILVFLFLFGHMIFLDGFQHHQHTAIEGFLIFPVIVWCGLRFSVRFMALVLLVVGLQGVLGIYRGQGYFAGIESQSGQLLNYCCYMVILSVIGMVLTFYVNERKLAQHALRSSQNHYHVLVNNSAILVWMSGLNKRCHYFNQAWFDFTGRSQEQEIDNGWLDGIHQEDVRHYLDTYTAAFDAREPFTIEYRLACADGSYRWMLSHGAPRYDESGQFQGYIGTLVDISSRKHAEKALSLRSRELALHNIILKQISSGVLLPKLLTELARQVEGLLSKSACALVLLDNQEQYTVHVASPSSGNFFQTVSRQLLSHNYRHSFSQIGLKYERIVIEDIQQQVEWEKVADLAKQADIHTLWSEPVINKDGRFLGLFVIGYKQIKKPTVNELALLERYVNLAELTIEHKQSEDALLDSEERLRLVLEGSELGFWDWQIKHNLVQRNAIWAETLGYQAHEIESSLNQWLSLVYHEDKKRALQSVKAVLSGERDIHEVDYRMVHKDGSLRWIHDHAKVVQKDPQGLPTRMSGIHVDITKMKRAEDELRIAAIAFQSQEGMFVTDTCCVILRINQSFTKITGYTEADTLGQTPRLFQSGLHKTDFYQTMWEQISQTGEWQGEIWNKRKNDEIFPVWLTITAVRSKYGEVTHYVATITDITTRKLAEEKIAQMAFYDALTHLPNRRLLMEHLEQCIATTKRENKCMALLMLDLDRFKQVNDSLGHKAGDQLLQQVSKRLSSRLRDADMVARLGGDEFIVLLADIKNQEDAGQVAAHIVEDLNQPFSLLQRNDVRIGVSIGISLCPQYSDTATLLMEQADMALYQAKNRGRGCYAYFSRQFASSHPNHQNRIV